HPESDHRPRRQCRVPARRAQEPAWRELAGDCGIAAGARVAKPDPSPYLPGRKGRLAMQSENKLFDDFVKMVNGFAGTMAGMGREAESGARERFKEWMGGADFVGREDFEARGWACERTAEGEIVASATGSWAQYELRGVWRTEDQVLQFLAFPDIKVALDKRLAIYEALSLINEQLWLGHFEMWSGSGLVVFRHSTILDGRAEDGLSLEQAEAIAEAAVEDCERFYPVFQFVLWGGKSPGEAIAAALIDTHGEA